MKKRHILSLLLVAAIVIAGSTALLGRDNSALLEYEEPAEETLEDGEIFLEDEEVPLSGLPLDLEPAPAVDPYEGLDETQIQYAEEILSLVNEERTQAGLHPLELDPNLRKAAQVRAAECVGTFSHTRPDGSSYKTAIAEAGVVSSYVGENVACGHSNAKQVMQGWMGSEGHKANILNKNFTKIGIGLEKNSGNGYKGYSWAQLFAK